MLNTVYCIIIIIMYVLITLDVLKSNSEQLPFIHYTLPILTYAYIHA